VRPAARAVSTNSLVLPQPTQACFADTIRHFGAYSPQVAANADLGVPFRSAAVDSETSFQDLVAYRAHVNPSDGCGWMDNTTLLTAVTLMSDAGPSALTPLTIWDVSTFMRAVVSYEHLYHHEHQAIDDAAINRRLGADVLRSVPLPLQPQPASALLPSPWDGPHRLMCEIWGDAQHWLKRLAEADSHTLDGTDAAAVRETWRTALDQPELMTRTIDVFDWRQASTRWTSNSDELLRQMVETTAVRDTATVEAPLLQHRELDRRRPELVGRLLTDLNLRAYITQTMADFFGLPYVCGAARVPFRKHLYDRAVAVQHRLTALDVIDDRYAAVAGDVRLQLPVFLALAARQARGPIELWESLAGFRAKATQFRSRRVELDAELARHNHVEAARVAKALTTDVDKVLAVAGKAVARAGIAVVEEVAKGDVMGIASGVTAIEAAGQELLNSSLIDRLMWRLRRPYLLWISDVMDEAKHINEALPDVARIWRIPERDHAMFAERFSKMGTLQTTV
jgi:hypothetical protein